MTVDEINKKLVEKYGCDLYNNPKFRIVWTSSQTEKRKGTFNEFYGSIFVRQVTGIREVPKYPFAKERWVLEGISPNPYSEEVDSKLSYEPLWVFQDKDGNFLMPVWRAIELIIYSLQNPEKLTPGQMDAKDEEKFKEEVEFFDNYLAGDSTWIGNALATREAVFIPTKES